MTSPLGGALRPFFVHGVPGEASRVRREREQLARYLARKSLEGELARPLIVRRVKGREGQP